MCGVVAALGRIDISPSLLRLSHRGIRSRIGVSSAGVVGHVRLPIVGLGEEHDQPMEKDGWLVAFVGELLDFRDTDPEAECDAEIVRDIWVNSGPPGFRSHDGFWGLVAIHEPSQSLHVLTDYLGQKPMYYRTDVPAAASEPDALLPFGPVTLDKVYLSAVVKWGYCPDVARTPYDQVRHLLPGHHGILQHNAEPILQHTDPLEPAPFNWMARDIEAAVKRRVLSADVQVACLVSGGLDSAIVYALASRYGNPVPYFVQDEDDVNDPEYRQAQEVVRIKTANIDSTNPCEVPLVRGIYRDVGVKTALDIMQEPVDLGSLRPQIALSRMVAQRVCLTGDGADELFGGYSRSLRYDSQFSDVFQELPAWHLPRLDRVMMRNKIEVRSPFLARSVVQSALAMPHNLRQDKNFLRAIFGDILPQSIRDAPKKALRAPEIERDREGYSKMLVDKFIERFDATQN